MCCIVLRAGHTVTRKQIPLAWRGRWTLYTVISGDPTRFYALISPEVRCMCAGLCWCPGSPLARLGVGVPVTLEGESELTREVRGELGCGGWAGGGCFTLNRHGRWSMVGVPRRPAGSTARTEESGQVWFPVPPGSVSTVKCTPRRCPPLRTSGLPHGRDQDCGGLRARA